MELFNILLPLFCIINTCFTLEHKALDYSKISKNKTINRSSIRSKSNFYNDRPFPAIGSYSSTNKTKVSLHSASSDNKLYYSPENYEKTTKKSSQIGLYVSAYPHVKPLTTTPMPAIKRVRPENLNRRFSKYTTVLPPEGHSEPENQSLTPSYVPNNDRDSKNLSTYPNFDEKLEVEIPVYFDDDEKVEEKNDPVWNHNKQNFLGEQFGKDLSSMQTSSFSFKNKKTKFKSGISKPKIGDQTTTEKAPTQPPTEYPVYGPPRNPSYPPKYYGQNANYYPYKDNSYMSTNRPEPNDHSGIQDFLSELASDFMSLFGANSVSEFEDDSLSITKTGSWLGPGIAGLLIGILPLTSIVISFIPAFVSVPVISTSPIGRRKKRQLQDSRVLNTSNAELFFNPVLNQIARYGMSSLEDSNCLQEMICMFTAEGRNKNTNLVQKLLFKIAKWTPVEWAKSMGVDNLLEAVKNEKCEATYQCPLQVANLI